MSEASMMMALFIPGPKSPSKDIDVLSKPLIDKLSELLSTGNETFDAVQKKSFTMRAAVMWTVNDFPAYLSGWSTSGYGACLTCMDETVCVPIIDKLSYNRHRRFLPEDHPMRRSKKFNNKREQRPPSTLLNGEEVLQTLQDVKDRPLGKHPLFGGKERTKRKRDERRLNWTKRPIFFNIPY